MEAVAGYVAGMQMDGKRGESVMDDMVKNFPTSVLYDVMYEAGTTLGALHIQADHPIAVELELCASVDERRASVDAHDRDAILAMTEEFNNEADALRAQRAR